MGVPNRRPLPAKCTRIRGGNTVNEIQKVLGPVFWNIIYSNLLYFESENYYLISD